MTNKQKIKQMLKKIFFLRNLRRQEHTLLKRGIRVYISIPLRVYSFLLVEPIHFVLDANFNFNPSKGLLLSAGTLFECAFFLGSGISIPLRVYSFLLVANENYTPPAPTRFQSL